MNKEKLLDYLVKEFKKYCKDNKIPLLECHWEQDENSSLYYKIGFSINKKKFWFFDYNISETEIRRFFNMYIFVDDLYKVNINHDFNTGIAYMRNLDQTIYFNNFRNWILNNK